MNTNPNAKRILLYGDSLVFGLRPTGVSRYDSATRFTGVLQNALGGGYEVIEEGLRGRMIMGENGFFPHRDGFQQFAPIFGSHAPVDVLVLSLGTNDANSRSEKSADDIEKAWDKYGELLEWCVANFKVPMPKVLLLAPPVVEEEFSYPVFKDIFKGAKERSEQFSELYKKVAKKHGWQFLDLSHIVKASEADGIHLTEEGNKTVGLTLAEIIKTVDNRGSTSFISQTK